MKTLLMLFISFASACLELNAQNTEIDRPVYSFSYPSSWKMDTDDPDYNLDEYFAIDIDENNLIMFFIMDQVDDEEMLNAQEDALKKAVMENPDKTSLFKKWGAYSGKGKMMKGKLMGEYPATIRIFVHNFKDKTLLVVLQCLDADLPRIGPGLNQIEDSFKLK